MKHLIILFSIWMFLGISYSQEDILYSFRGTHYSESKQSMTSCNLEFRYNWKKDVLILIMHEDSSMYAGYLFTEAQRDSMNFMINKYLKWHKTAMDMDTEVDKAIHEIYLTGYDSTAGVSGEKISILTLRDQAVRSTFVWNDKSEAPYPIEFTDEAIDNVGKEKKDGRSK